MFVWQPISNTTCAAPSSGHDETIYESETSSCTQSQILCSVVQGKADVTNSSMIDGAVVGLYFCSQLGGFEGEGLKVVRYIPF